MKVFTLKNGQLEAIEAGKLLRAKDGSRWVSLKDCEAELRKYQSAAAKGNPYPIGSTESWMREFFR